MVGQHPINRKQTHPNPFFEVVSLVEKTVASTIDSGCANYKLVALHVQSSVQRDHKVDGLCAVGLNGELGTDRLLTVD